MNIIVVRHGQTNWNILDKLQGSTDIPLNENGILQANETSKLLKDTKIDFIFCSPLSRTKDTANIINKFRNLEIIFDDRLIERTFGDFEGIDGKKINIKDYWNTKSNLCTNNIEPIKDLFNRVYNFLLETILLYEKTDKTILLVTHNGVNLALTTILLGQKDNIFDYNLKPCEYRVFKNVKLEEINGKYKI